MRYLSFILLFSGLAFACGSGMDYNEVSIADIYQRIGVFYIPIIVFALYSMLSSSTLYKVIATLEVIGLVAIIFFSHKYISSLSNSFQILMYAMIYVPALAFFDKESRVSRFVFTKMIVLIGTFLIMVGLTTFSNVSAMNVIQLETTIFVNKIIYGDTIKYPNTYHSVFENFEHSTDTNDTNDTKGIEEAELLKKIQLKKEKLKKDNQRREDFGF